MEPIPGTARHENRRPTGVVRFHLEVDGQVPPDLLCIAEQAVAEMNRRSARAEARAAARQLSDALDDVRRRGHRAWLVST